MSNDIDLAEERDAEFVRLLLADCKLSDEKVIKEFTLRRSFILQDWNERQIIKARPSADESDNELW